MGGNGKTQRQKRSSTAGNLRSIVAEFDTNVAIDISQLRHVTAFLEAEQTTRIRIVEKNVESAVDFSTEL